MSDTKIIMQLVADARSRAIGYNERVAQKLKHVLETEGFDEHGRCRNGYDVEVADLGDSKLTMGELAEDLGSLCEDSIDVHANGDITICCYDYSLYLQHQNHQWFIKKDGENR